MTEKEMDSEFKPLSYFKVFADTEEKCQYLTDEEFGRLVRLSLRYSKTGIKPTEDEFVGNERFAIAFFISDIDRERKNYKKKCLANQINGSKGGRPRKNSVVVSEKTQEQDHEKEQAQDYDQGQSEDYYEYEQKNNEKGILEYLTEVIGHRPSDSAIAAISAYVADMGSNAVKAAIDEGMDRGHPEWPYIRAILNSWQTDGIKYIQNPQYIPDEPVMIDEPTPEEQEDPRNDLPF